MAAHLSRAGIVTVIIIALPVSAQAADPAQEAASAATHAGLAAQGASIEQVHMHLHHTVNCLVGPKGPGSMLWKGILTRSSAMAWFLMPPDKALKAKLTVLGRAQAGLKSDDLAAARKAATEALTALK